MTRRELSQVYHLRKEIEEDRARLHRLEAAATSASPSNGGSGGSGIPTDRTAIAASIADLRAQIADKVEREHRELIRLMDYIDTISDALTRRIFKLRFADGLSWAAIANRIGGGNTPDMARQRCYRYLRDN
jgi:hypothetical protein